MEIIKVVLFPEAGAVFVAVPTSFWGLELTMETSKRYEKEETKYSHPLKMTKALLEEYRIYLINRGCEAQTISMYFCYLKRLYAFLPKEKELTEENLKGWVEALQNKGYSDRTINMHISSVNGLLRFCGHKIMHISVTVTPCTADMPELTREEYLRLLSYVKIQGPKRDYLLIKTLATVDISVIDLILLTVEACQKGIVNSSNQKESLIPDSLQEELLAYIEEQNLKTGPVFVSKTGKLLDRSNMTHTIARWGKKAGISSKKCNPRALHQLYLRTQEEIHRELMPFQRKAYEDLLNEEQMIVNKGA